MGGSLLSSPCSMHELENDWEKVKTWRNARRKSLVKLRVEADAGTRCKLNRAIVTRLAGLLNPDTYPTLGIYWPIRGEIDVRELARIHLAAGGQTALPVIVTKHAPVEFWQWHPGMRTAAWRARYSSSTRAPCCYPRRSRHSPARFRSRVL